MKKIITFTTFVLLLLIILAMGACTQAPIVFTIKYSAGEGGSIEGNSEQSVEQGKDGSVVTAVADSGYEFVKWSDNITTVSRQDKNINADIEVTAIFDKIDNASKSFTIYYFVEEGGRLLGDPVQVISGDICTQIEVLANDGYEFVEWSDGYKSAQRSDHHVDEDKTFVAKMRRIDKYKLMNWYVENKVGVPTIEINEKNYDNLSFPVPTREHFTFEGWYFNDTLVADANGVSYFTKEMLASVNRYITAKWTANETYNYKLLLVCVTRIDATLPTVKKDSKIHVDYRMNGMEKEFYRLTAIRLKEYLNGLTDGLVDFQVDTYYTQNTVVTEDFVQLDEGSNYLHANQIPEVADLIKEYDSAISLFSMNDIDSKLHAITGSAEPKYGQVYMDSFYYKLKLVEYTLEQAVDVLENSGFEDLCQNNSNKLASTIEIGWFDVIVHELAHTIECRINGDEYHEINNELIVLQRMPYFEGERYYYLHGFRRDHRQEGIPYDFWAGNIFQVRYEPTEGGGYIQGQKYYYQDKLGAHCMYDVPYGYDTPAVTAVPYEGYEFVGWSDGIKTAERAALCVTENMTITAVFKPKTYKLTIVASEGGSLLYGEGTWELQPYDCQRIKAAANEGYRFVGWSDGQTNSESSFVLDDYGLKLFDENRQYTLVAIFEKIGEKSDYYVLNFVQRENGYYIIHGVQEKEKNFLMKKGVDKLKVAVNPKPGYKFVCWSDGNTEMSRTFIVNSHLTALSDENNTITIYAVYEKISEESNYDIIATCIFKRKQVQEQIVRAY